MQLISILTRAHLIANTAILVSLILTLWPNRHRLVAAAILYVIGLLVNMGAFAYSTGFFVWMTYGLSGDSGSPSKIAFIGLIWPVWAICYAISVAAFLWSSIPQKRALRWGKILHLAVGFPLIGLPALGGVEHNTFAFDAGWFVYVLLWFRIRENYNGVFTAHSAINPTGSRNLEPP